MNFSSFHSPQSSHSTQLVVEEVHSSSQHKAFIQLPWDVLPAVCPQWVPPLRLSLEAIFSKKHPFYRTAEMKRWLVKRGDRYVGRIAAIINRAHNEFHEETCAHFGFFDCINDKEVAGALMHVAAEYARQRGMTELRGPMNPSTNYECGLLVEGFEDPPQLMMTYNPPYYQTLLEDLGLTKAMDLLAFRLSTRAKIPEKIVRIADKITHSHQITWRTVKKANWKAEVDLMLEIYNEAWERNWGFIPMTPDEFRHLCADLKSICLEELVLVVEVRGRAAGFIVALPDFNQIFHKIPSGKLLPWGIWKLLTGQKSINRARIITMGIRREYRPLGLSTLLYTQLQKQFLKVGQYHEAEMSWILETNQHMVKPLVLMGAEVYKTYRIYEKNLGQF